MACTRTHLFMIVMATLLAGPSWGAVFSCDGPGLDAAIQTAEFGDPGPHSLDCATGDEFGFQGTRIMRADLTLDAQGATARCVGDAPVPGFRCGLAFSLGCPSRVCDERPTIELRNLIIPAPMLLLGGFGDGVVSGRADVTLRNVSVIEGGGEQFGIGIRVGSREGGTLHLVESTVSGFGTGVLVSDASSATIERSSIANNALLGLQLGLGATGQLVDSTISGPSHGIWNGGMLTIVNSTIVSGGVTPLPEGVAFAYSDRVLIVCQGFVFAVSAGHATATNSVIGGSCDIGGAPGPLPPGCPPFPLPSTMTSTGGNVESPGDTCQFTDPTDQVNVSAAELALGPLQNNGGPTDTHALLEGSAAIDAAVLANCTPTDQRGVERPQGVDCDAGAYEAEVLTVEIDIKPGNDLNPINPTSRGVIPVAILGSDTFDVADVDVTTLAIGPNGARLAHQNGPHVKDANNDGLDDLLAHFLTQESGIAIGDEEACVTGELLDGTPIEGCDIITTEPPCGRGYEAALLLPPLLWVRRQLRRVAA